MTDVLERLKPALADRYTIERELGRGGMATVYLAEDVKHHRRVALKVLRPELAASLGAERFLREIEIASQLTHPNILTLIDSGTADGLLYYIMPFVEGESLRARLNREKQLPLDDALQIAREVADALSVAHAEGVVHRDIKPENILLEAGHAVVTDFGIAHAVTTAGGEQLTETGIAVGTQAYMSPEQASAEKEIDARSDVYSLACVLYEMLAGETPYTGPSAQAILARKALDPVPPLRRMRDTVSLGVDQAVTKALAKVPADRFATAQGFAHALGEPGVESVRPKTRRLSLAVGAVVLMVAVALVLWLELGRRGESAIALDPNLVAVMPFRTAGADPSLAYLREGMVDLLGLEFTGEVGPHALDSRTVLRAWNRRAASQQEDLALEESVQLARELGAGLLLLGEVLVAGENLVLQASLINTENGETPAQGRVDGPGDSLLALVDALTAKLLVGEAHQYQERRGDLSQHSLPAVRAYLAGEAAYRRAEYQEAVDHFDRALREDSTFALAALGLARAADWGPVTRTISAADARRLAWTYRAGLNVRDSAFLAAKVGPRYPDRSSLAEILTAFQQALELAPDRHETWYQYADILFHFGPVLGLEGSMPRALAAFEEAAELDSTATDPLGHLAEHAAAVGDTAALRTIRARISAVSPTMYSSFDATLDAARAFRDTEALDSLRHLMDTLGHRVPGGLGKVMWDPLSTMRGLDDADRAAALLEVSPAPPFFSLWIYSLERGRPKAALRYARSTDPVPPGLWPSRVGRTSARLWDALYHDGDSAAAAAVVVQVTAVADAPLPDTGRETMLDAVCTLEQWRLAHGNTTTADRGIRVLRQASRPVDDPDVVVLFHTCATVLEAMLATAIGRPDSRLELEALDSLLRTGPLWAWGAMYLDPWNLMAARLWEAHGDLPRALAAARRQVRYGLQLRRAPMLRAEGRLAALTGDTAGAIRAYRQYIALRSNPEPALADDVGEVRAELRMLVGEPDP